MTYAYLVKYYESNRTVSTGVKNLDEIIDMVSGVKNSSNFTLFEYRDSSEKGFGIEPAISNINKHRVEELDGTKKSIIDYLNKIKK